MNSKGHALFLVLLTIVFISVIGVGLLTVTANANKTTVHEKRDQGLYYIAESGVNYTKSNVIHFINQKVDEAAHYINTLPNINRTQDTFKNHLVSVLKQSFCLSEVDTSCNKFHETHQSYATVDGKQPVANVAVKFDCLDFNQCKFIITSTGKYIGESKEREVEQQIQINLDKLANVSNQTTSGNTTTINPPMLDDIFKGFAAVALETITLKNNGEIEGNVGIFSDMKSISVANISKNDDLKQHDLSMYKDVDFNILLPPFPSFPTDPIDFTKITQSVTTSVQANGVASTPTIQKKDINTMDLTSGAYFKIKDLEVKDDLLINIGNHHVILEIENLTVKKPIKISGNGKLHLVVSNSFVLENEVNAVGNVNRLAIYYVGSNDLVTIKDVQKTAIDDSNAYIGGDFYVYDRNVQFLNAKGIGGTLYSAKGKIEIDTSMVVQTIEKLSGTLVISKAATIHTIKMNIGTIDIPSYPTIENMFLNKVDVSFDHSLKAKISQMFYLNDGIVNLKNDVNFQNIYVQHKGQLISSNQTIFNTIYLGVVNLSSLNSIDVKGNFYGKNIELTFSKSSNLRGNVYLQEGRIDANNFVDFDGNIYYGGKNGIVLNKFVDAKKQQLIVAPNATITIQGSADVKGTVIGKNIIIDNTAYIKYEKPVYIDPYYSETPIPTVNEVIFTPINEYYLESPLIEK